MTNQEQAKPASAEAKRVIELWNASLNSGFLPVETEDGPNPPEIIVNVRSDAEDKFRAAKSDLKFLARIMETATIQHIPLAKNEAGEMKPTEEGQKALDESGESSGLTLALLMTLAMVFIADDLDNLSAEDMLAALQVLSQTTDDSADDEPSSSLQIREKVIGQEDGHKIKHITINVLSVDADADKDLKGLQEEFVHLYKTGKITVRLKPYTKEEIEAFNAAAE